MCSTINESCARMGIFSRPPRSLRSSRDGRRLQHYCHNAQSSLLEGACTNCLREKYRRFYTPSGRFASASLKQGGADLCEMRILLQALLFFYSFLFLFFPLVKKSLYVIL